MNNKVIHPGRLMAIIGIIGVLILVYLGNLIYLQLVKGEEYLDESRNSLKSTKIVEAARGSILDRYGRVLVTNRACNNLTINASRFFGDTSAPDFNETANAKILSACQLMQEFDEIWTDELPITRQAPFEYTDMSDIQATRLNAWKKANNLAQDCSAVEVMARMRERYGIDNNYNSTDTRTIAGVRYEINVRWLINTSDDIYAEDVSMDLITTFMERNFDGFEVTTSYVREYETTNAAHLLGYIGYMNEREYTQYKKDGYSLNAKVGKDGAEYAFENYLHGHDGEARVTTTSTGVITSTVYTDEPRPGYNCYLTIDLDLQETCENALSSFITNENNTRAEATEMLVASGGDIEAAQPLITGGGAVVVDVNTGEPLAIASWPTFDLAHLMENYTEILKMDNSPMFNRALQGVYPPGSTFKPCVAIAGLTEGAINTGSIICCEGVFRKYGDAGYAPQCWIYSFDQMTHQDLNVIEALTVSCNYFFYTVGDTLKVTKMAKYAALFGLGEDTGIELYEDEGQMSTNALYMEEYGREMYSGDTIQASIGQAETLFNPLQLAEYCATIANGGTRHSASILKSVRTYDYTETVYMRSPEVLSYIDTSQLNWDAVHQGMYGVANNYGLSPAVAEVFIGTDYTVAAKTGTAQTGVAGANNGVFICYAPYENPEVAVAVAIEKAGAGASTAPVARAILDYYFDAAGATATIEGEGVLLQ